jgi:hypothetical protein
LGHWIVGTCWKLCTYYAPLLVCWSWLCLQVLRGYVGDRDAKPVFQGDTPFDILGKGYQRPFELATLRLFNMVGILPKCEQPVWSVEGAMLLVLWIQGNQVLHVGVSTVPCASQGFKPCTLDTKVGYWRSTGQQ